jgi:hypothetical protein
MARFNVPLLFRKGVIYPPSDFLIHLYPGSPVGHHIDCPSEYLRIQIGFREIAKCGTFKGGKVLILFAGVNFKVVFFSYSIELKLHIENATG